MPPMQNWRRLARVVFRIVLPAAVIVAVAWYFVEILSNPKLREVTYAFRVEWLFPAALLYLMAHTIWASFWVILLRNQGFHATYPTGWRAYFISQYGKYIPGKVWVILIRIVMLGASKKDKAIVGVTATYETLTSMAAGAMLGAILLLTLHIEPLIHVEVQGIQVFQMLNYVLVVVALVPLGLGLLHRLIVGIARRKRGAEAPPIPNMNLLVLARGMVQASGGFFLLALSLWMTMQAILLETTALDWNKLLRLTAISSIAYIIGFIFLFLPGGVGARELALAALLGSELKEAHPDATVAMGMAVVITLVLRLVWTIAELVLGLLLYWFIPAAHRPPLIHAAKELVE